MRRFRGVARVGIVAGATVVCLAGTAAAALPAFAAKETGIDPGKSLGIGLTLLIFVGVPLGLFVFLALLIYGPGMLRRPRYRPGYQEWGYRSLWIGGPADPDAALTSMPPDTVIDTPGGGAGAGW
ncbi:MAG: hypothetical protein ACJ735_07175 [Actinomycetes bacterium]